MMRICARIVAVLLIVRLFDAVLNTAKTPVILKLSRKSVTQSNITESVDSSLQPRSKPKLFEKVLGLEPGEPFNLQLEKWSMLQQSGLFRNLSAKSFLPSDDQIALEVSGIELPSIYLSPEVTLQPSIDEPEVSGGVSSESIHICVEHD